jgi:hypothetical protein
MHVLKQCIKCNKEAPHVIRDGTRPRAYCIECQRIYAHEYYLRNKTRHRGARLESNKRQRIRARTFVQKIKERPCKDCKVQYPYYIMQFDHTVGKKEFNIGRRGGRTVYTLADEIRKCDVVCANCHAIRTHKRSRLKERSKKT